MSLEDKDIDKLFREGLGDMKLPYDPNGWSTMQTKLKKAKIFKLWLSISLSIVTISASALLFFYFSSLNQIPNNTDSKKNTAVTSQSTHIQNEVNTDANTQHHNHIKEQKVISKNKKLSNRNKVLRNKLNAYSNETYPNTDIKTPISSTNSDSKIDNSKELVNKHSTSENSEKISIGANTLTDNSTGGELSTTDISKYGLTENSIDALSQSTDINSSNENMNKKTGLITLNSILLDEYQPISTLHNDSVMLDFNRDTNVRKGAWGIELYLNKGQKIILSHSNYESAIISNYSNTPRLNVSLGLSYYLINTKKVWLSTTFRYRNLGYKEELELINDLGDVLEKQQNIYDFRFLELDLSFNYIFLSEKKTSPFINITPSYSWGIDGVERKTNLLNNQSKERMTVSLNNQNLSLRIGAGIKFHINNNYEMFTMVSRSETFFPSIEKPFWYNPVEFVEEVHYGITLGIKKNLFKTIKLPLLFK